MPYLHKVFRNLKRGQIIQKFEDMISAKVDFHAVICFSRKNSLKITGDCNINSRSSEKQC